MAYWEASYKATIDGRICEVCQGDAGEWLGYVTFEGKRVLVTVRNNRQDAMKDCASHRGARLAAVKPG